jgi:hypothetical protein
MDDLKSYVHRTFRITNNTEDDVVLTVSEESNPATIEVSYSPSLQDDEVTLSQGETLTINFRASNDAGGYENVANNLAEVELHISHESNGNPIDGVPDPIIVKQLIRLPLITNINPASGNAGATLEFTGTNFTELPIEGIEILDNTNAVIETVMLSAGLDISDDTTAILTMPGSITAEGHYRFRFIGPGGVAFRTGSHSTRATNDTFEIQSPGA